ncbi:MAG: hypothetical protein V1813_03235 [Candidatus Aenigmatarchaeota archaeon]
MHEVFKRMLTIPEGKQVSCSSEKMHDGSGSITLQVTIHKDMVRESAIKGIAQSIERDAPEGAKTTVSHTEEGDHLIEVAAQLPKGGYNFTCKAMRKLLEAHQQDRPDHHVIERQQVEILKFVPKKREP